MLISTSLTKDDILDIANEYGTLVEDTARGFVTFSIDGFLDCAEALIEESAISPPDLDTPMDLFISKALANGMRDALNLRYHDQPRWPVDDPYVSMYRKLTQRIQVFEVDAISTIAELEAEQ